MKSKIYEICQAYELGFGNGVGQTGRDCARQGTPATAEIQEAYGIGYQQGLSQCFGDKSPALPVSHDGLVR